jgi:hypothetical protein
MGQTGTYHFDGVGSAEGSGTNRILSIAGVPGAGTDEVQTLTIGGTPTGGTFKLAFESQITSAITWSATDVTLLANIQAALDALTSLGTNGCVAAAGTLSSGIGTITLTFGAARAKEAVALITVYLNSLTGTNPTLAIVETTPGVTAAFRGWPVGQLVKDVTNKILYINTGTATAPTWTKVGAQT